MYRELGVAGKDCALGVRDSLKSLGTPWYVRERGKGAPLAFSGEGSRGHCSQIYILQEWASRWFISCGISHILSKESLVQASKF